MSDFQDRVVIINAAENALALEGANRNIRSNCLAPVAATRMTNNVAGMSAFDVKPRALCPARLLWG